MTDSQVSFSSAPPPGLGVAIDRSQAITATVNTKLCSWGGGSTNATWSALQGAGSEAAGLIDGLIVNESLGVAWRVLQYSLPIRLNVTTNGDKGNVGPLSDTFILDALIGTNTVRQTDTGVFLMQWAGVAANVVLPSGGAPVGMGFRPDTVARTVQAWTSVGGAGNTSVALPGATLRRCVLTIVNGRLGIPGTYTMMVDGAVLQSGTLVSAMGADYTIAAAAFAPVVSAGSGNTLYWADLQVFNAANYL